MLPLGGASGMSAVGKSLPGAVIGSGFSVSDEGTA